MDSSTQSRARARAVLLGVLLAAASCSVDERGLALSSGGLGAAAGAAHFSTGGRVGTGSGGRIVIPEGTGGGGATVAAGGGGTPGRGGGPGPGTGGGESLGTGGRSASGGTGATGGPGSGGQGAFAGQNASGGQGGNPITGACNASTCPDGCCMGAVCRKNRNNQRCGVAGAACAPCPACTLCSSLGVCSLDPEAPWDVICASAVLAPTMPQNTNGAWDTDATGIGALPDPFCQLTMNGNGNDTQQTTTETLMNTLTPVWEASITGTSTKDVLSSQPWDVAVIDDDFGATADDVACTITPQLTDADFVAGSVYLPPTRRCLSVTIRLVCAQ